MTILSKACTPDNFGLHYSLKLSFKNIQGLRLNFVDCDSFLESNSPDIVALCATNLDDSLNWFSVRGYLPLIQRVSSTHTLCKRRTSFSTGIISRKLCKFLLVFSNGFTPLNVLLFFSSIDHLLHLCAVFDSISSNIDEVLLINPSVNAFVFGDLTFIIRTDLHILVELINLVNSLIIFLKWSYPDGQLFYSDFRLWFS